MVQALYFSLQYKNFSLAEPKVLEVKSARVFRDSAMGRLLSVTQRIGAGDQLVDLYVKDFVQMIYKSHCKVTEIEYEVSHVYGTLALLTCCLVSGLRLLPPRIYIHA